MPDAPAAHLQPGKRVRISLPGGMRLMTKALFLRVLREVLPQLGVRLQVDGAQMASTQPDGASLRLMPGADTVSHPFKGERRNGALWVRGGFVNTVELEDAEVGNGTGYAWVRVEFDLSVEWQFVFTATLTLAVIDHGTSVPADDPVSGVFHVVLFQYASGRLVSQSVTANLVVRACDDGSGTGQAALNLIAY